MIEAGPHSEIWKRPHWRRYYFDLIRRDSAARDSAAVERIPVQEEAIFDIPIVAFHGTRDQWVSKEGFMDWRDATLGFVADSACAWAAVSLVGDVVTSEYKLNMVAPAGGDDLLGAARSSKFRKASCLLG
jgi:hypothetical protein